MQDSTSNPKSNATTRLSEESAPITEANLQEMVGTVTQGKFGKLGVAQAVKSGVVTPEEVIKLAEQEWANKQGRKFTLPSLEVRQQSYDNDELERLDYDRYKQPFMFPEFSPNGDLYLGPGLTLIGGKTGRGKTSLLANLLAGFVTYRPDTIAVVILNEEKGGTLLQRVACVLLKASFPRFFFGRLQTFEEDQVRKLARELAARIVVFNGDAMPDGSYYDTSCLEDVKTIVGGAPSVGANLVLGDYWQNVNFSRDNPTLETWQISKDLGFFMKEFGRKHKVPVGWFCQLKGEDESKDFKDRVENDKHLANHAYTCIELKPDKETCMTTFQIWKQRWAFDQQYKVVLRFDQGRYVQEQVGL